MSPIYNRYVTDGGQYNRVTPQNASPVRQSGTGASSPLGALGNLFQKINHRPPGGNSGGLTDMLKNLLPAGIDTGDLLLLLILLLLYLESEDEDFLIMLVVIGYSVLKG